jgi:hypothetical protein
MNDIALSTAEWAARINAAWAKVHTVDSRRSKRERREGDESKLVEIPLASFLREIGYQIKRQVSCCAGRIDILNITTKELIECKAKGNGRSLYDAAFQLKHYQTFYPDHRLVIAVPSIKPDYEWFAEALRSARFCILEVEKIVENSK